MKPMEVIRILISVNVIYFSCSSYDASANIAEVGEKTVDGYIYFSGSEAENDSDFHIPSRLYDVEVVNLPGVPVLIDNAFAFSAFDFWADRVNDGKTLYRYGDNFRRCAWEVGGRASGSIFMSISARPGEIDFEAIKINVVSRDDFGEVSRVGTESVFERSDQPNIFMINAESGKSYGVRGKFYIFIAQVLLSDGKIWEAEHDYIVSQFDIPNDHLNFIGSIISAGSPKINFSPSYRINVKNCDPKFFPAKS